MVNDHHNLFREVRQLEANYYMCIVTCVRWPSFLIPFISPNSVAMTRFVR